MESESLIEWGLEIPRDYNIPEEGNYAVGKIIKSY